MQSRLKNIVALAGLLLSLGAGLPAHAAALRIGLAADVSTLDPHYLNIAPNIALASHMFDTLVAVNPDGQLVPGLAVSWRAVDATTWEFRLRSGVKFHDGTELTAEDVLFSLDRPATLVSSPGPFTSYTKQIVAKEAPDPHTIILKTARPYGPLPLDLSSIFIVSKKAALHAKTADFNSGKAAIGSGPFKLVQFLRGDRIELARNEFYWGEKPAWDKVSLRILTSNAPRLAALLAGDVDAIEGVPAAHIERIKADPNLHLEQKVSWRTLFWHLDQSDRPSPFITDKAGKPLPRNPLRDIRVRQAISRAIDRQALVSRTMEGLALPASNLVAPGIFGHNPDLPVEKYDPEGAKKLLTQAGYPDGFALMLHGPNNRYINDAAVVQTVAQFLNRVGIATRVQTLPLSVYFGKARNGEFSAALLGWGSLAGDFALRTVVGTSNPQTGWGSWNWGKYSNPAVDDLVRHALSSVEPAQREEFARDAAGIALGEYAVVPLHHQYATWAMRKGLKYTARTDEFTFAHLFHPQ
ncbi:ABC transporter substrate-binding protein [Paucimonas lemoignei]|nr:ABC transporter substrate-binding protein [Paucimonas lemoignei]